MSGSKLHFRIGFICLAALFLFVAICGCTNLRENFRSDGLNAYGEPLSKPVAGGRGGR